MYIKLATKLAKKHNSNNLNVLQYNGSDFPCIPKVDVIFEKGVFERLNKVMVKAYIEKLKEYLSEDGIIIIYFLMEKATNTVFTKRFGDSAYVFWNRKEIEKLLKSNGLKIKELINGEYADYYVCEQL
jgi:cyclopropane fatty-acyl-phospholipid synthase-like methyltransferase